MTKMASKFDEKMSDFLIALGNALGRKQTMKPIGTAVKGPRGGEGEGRGTPSPQGG